MGRLFPALILAAGLLVAPPARAASYDPDLQWRTLETEHFRVTFHGGEEALAEEYARVAEDVWRTMTPELRWQPRRKTELVLIDPTDSANGFAYTVPVNTIVVFVTTPREDSSLSDYDVWSRSILMHEYTHLLHLDTVEGAPAALRRVLGRVIGVNTVSPRWIVEGYATFEETRQTVGGRGRSTLADMVKRAAALEDRFPPLGNMDGWQVAPPAGNLRYLFGQDFIQYVSDRTGEKVWTDWTHLYGSRAPFLLPSKKAFGETLTALYYEWKADFIARYERQRAEVEARGLTNYRLLNAADESCAGPSFSPDGAHLVWSCNDPKAGSAVYMSGPDGRDPKTELDNWFGTEFSWRPDSQAFVFSASHTVARYNTYEDVYFYKLGGKPTSLTSGARATDPAFSPDGDRLWVVTNKLQQNRVANLTIDQRLNTVVQGTDHTVFATPRPSPDGRYVAITVFREGIRDLWLYTAEGEPYRRLSADESNEIHPAWSSDGRTLYFSSDRTGIYNLYALDLETERLWQVTNVLGGAFNPSPNPQGTLIAFESYSADGTDIGLLEIDRSQWRDAGVLGLPIEARGALAAALPEPAIDPAPPPPPPKPPQEKKGWHPFDQDRRTAKKAKTPKKKGVAPLVEESGWADPYSFDGLDRLGGPFHLASMQPGTWGRPGEGYVHPVEDEGAADDTNITQELEEDAEAEYPFSYPVERYRPRTLLPPRWIVPSLYQTPYGYMGTLSTGGSDVLRRYLYGAYISYRTDSQFVGWGASVAINRWTPIFSLGAYSDTSPYGDVYVTTQPPSSGGAWIPSIESTNTRYWDKRVRSYAQVSYELDAKRAVFARWSGSHRTSLNALPDNVYTPALPTRGFLSSVGGGWRYAWGRSYGESISPEDARIVSLVGELYHPWLGSYTLNDDNQWEGFTELQATAEWREYVSMPWLNNHVLAWKLAVGASVGDAQRYGAFRLGGDFGESGYFTLPDEWRALRGFPSATVDGNSYYVSSVEYRLPLWWIDRGLGTVPVYGRYLSAAAFLDAGNAIDDLSEVSGVGVFQSSLVGAGAELRGQAILGWGWGLTGRVGYAFAVHGEGGYPLGSLEGFYAWFGTTF